MFLGIYYNLSIWYKLSNRTMYGALITLVGAAVTLLINYLLIPHFSYVACAWATFVSYGVMMVISYMWGQKIYPVPYPTKKLIAYLVIAVSFFMIHKGIDKMIENTIWSLTIATVLLMIYILFIGLIEQKELPKLPLIGKYFSPKK